MAIALSHIETDVSDAEIQNYTTGSQTPTADYLQLLTVMGDDGSSAPTNQPTVSGCGLTWVAVADVTETPVRTTVFRALGGSPSTGSLTIGWGESVACCGWSWSELSGIDTSGSNGSGAIVQSTTNGTGGAASSLTVTLASFADATNNVAYGGIGLDHNSTAITYGDGFTEIAEDQIAGAYGKLQSQWRTGEDTSVDWSWTGALEACGVAVEVKMAPAGGFGPTLLIKASSEA